LIGQDHFVLWEVLGFPAWPNPLLKFFRLSVGFRI
jgi:hypothetical protein